MTREEFITKVGRQPEHDDLERVNCDRPGEIGHFCCGWCPRHNWPRFQCGCRHIQGIMDEGRCSR